MKTLYSSGTLGDSYVILCKLYNLAKQEKIKLIHSSIQEKMYQSILEVFSIMPNIEVELNSTHVECCLQGHFAEFQEGVKYQTEYFPKFNLPNTKHKLPEFYQVIQLQSGRPEQKRQITQKNVEQIIEHATHPLVIIGTDNLYSFDNVIDLRGKTTLKEAMGIVSKSQKLHAFIGLMTYVAVSHKVQSDVYVNRKYDGSDLRLLNNPWERYSKVIKQ